MTVNEVIKKSISTLGNIEVPVARMETIGKAIQGVIMDLMACRDYLDGVEQRLQEENRQKEAAEKAEEEKTDDEHADV